MIKRNVKFYLGDSVYADFDGYGIVLTTENGISVTNTIVLEPEVYEVLVAYRQHLEDIARRNSREEDDCREAQDNTPSKGPFEKHCQLCGRATFGFDERGPLCIDCAVVKAMKEGI